MKNMRSGFRFILSGLLFAFIAPAVSSAQTIESPTAAPTGTYAPMSRITPSVSPFTSTNTVQHLFTLRLETNGTYVAKTDIYGETDVARGTWHWDSEKQEFLLEPGSFIFYIKRLPVDKRNPTRLVHGAGFLERLESK